MYLEIFKTDSPKMTKILLTVIAIFEGLVGVGLFFTPVVVASILLNTPLETAGGLVAARPSSP
jgi:hypothetical protein